MKRATVFILGIGATILAASTTRAEDFSAVTCEGVYPGHLQGVCTDGSDAIFWSFSTQLVKTDRAGRRLKQVSVPFHHGDPCFHDGKVYVAVNLGKFNDPEGNADSWVYVYEADDLSRVAMHETPEVFHGAGGIAHHDGKFVVVGGLPDGVNENYAYEYDADFSFVKKHVLASGHTHLGIQTATFADGHWWFGCYGQPKTADAPALPHSLLKVDASLTNITRFDFNCSYGITPVAEGKFFIGAGGRTDAGGHIAKLNIAVVDRDRGLKVVARASAAHQ